MTLTPTSSKAAWRAWAFALRRGHSDASAEVVQHLIPFLHDQGVQRVLAYRALSGEPDISALHGDFELFTTRTRYKPEKHLTIHPWDTATERTKFGYLQPPASAPQVPLSDMDAVLLPGLAFDRHGVRLGYGGGFYDRLLSGDRGLKVGVVWAELLVPRLPHEPHDIRTDWVVTPDGLVQCRP